MATEIDVHKIRSRPRFKVITYESCELFTRRLNRHFNLHQKVLAGSIHSDMSIIILTKDKEKFWAPQLQIRTEDDPDNPDLTIIRGLFGPKPAIWTLFMFLYFLGGTFLSFFGMIWFVNWKINLSSDLVWGAWLGLAILIGTYLASKIGQRIAKSHMSVLETFIETVLIEEIDKVEELK